jgi:tetratricopeptide (TPR) repeat protein
MEGPSYERNLTGEDARRVEELEKKTEQFRQAGNFKEAQTAARTILEVRSRVQGANHWQTGDARRLLSTLEKITALTPEARGELTKAAELDRATSRLEGQGRYAEATALRRQQMDIYRRLLGEESPDAAVSSNSLAVNLYAQRKYGEVEPLLQKMLAINRQALGEAHPFTALSYNGLAVMLSARGKFAEAEPLLQKALAIRCQVLGPAHPETALSYNNLAANLNARAKYTDAETLYHKALAIRRQTLGELHTNTAASYSNLATNLDAQGKYAEAEPLYQKALAIRSQVLGKAHLETAQCYNNLAANLNDQGKYAEAESLFRMALTGYRRALGEAHPDTALSYNNLAANLNAQGKYAEAEPLLQKVLALNRQALGEAHPQTAASYNNLAFSLNGQGKYAEAEPRYRKALAINCRALGEAHPDTARSYNNLALHLNGLGKFEEAERLFRKALATYRQALGEAHRDTGLCCNNLGLNLYSQGKYAEAGPLYRKALEISRKALGEAHPETASSYNNLAINLNAQGKYEEARDLGLQGEQAMEMARLRTISLGLERAYFDTSHSALSLIRSLVRAGQGTQAWSYLESKLARGLLDEMSASRSRPLPAAEQQRVQTLSGQLRRLEKEITSLVNAKESVEQVRGPLQALLQQRKEEETELARIAAAQSAREVYNLERVQSQLPADAALVAWVDVQGQPIAADPHEEHRACVVRHKGKPVWINLSGSGSEGAWTKDDDKLLSGLQQALSAPPEAYQGDKKSLMGRALAQRLTPLEPCLREDAENQPVKHLLIEPAWSMAGIPLEALTSRYTISYVPSGTLFARLCEQRPQPHTPATKTPRLLAVGAPNFQRPASPIAPEGPLPATGLLITRVVPNLNAAKNGLRTGDVLLGYAGIQLSTLADLQTALGNQPEAKSGEDAGVKVEAWRDGKTFTVRVPPGPLGIHTSSRSPKEEILAKRDGDRALLASRGKPWEDLPGARQEIAAIARLFDRPVTLIGSEASEQRLDALAAAGELKQFRYLHFATHGQVNPRIALESALILAQDQLPDPVDQILAGKHPYDGRLTAAEMRRWKLDADLVTLSACETGLGQRLGGEGYLGFAQALFAAGARSVLLSLWPVDDPSIALLMTRFYQNLLGRRPGLEQPLPKALALHEAKQWLRELPLHDAEELTKKLPTAVRAVKSRPQAPARAVFHPYEDPYFWAGFILIGDPQ